MSRAKKIYEGSVSKDITDALIQDFANIKRLLPYAVDEGKVVTASWIAHVFVKVDTLSKTLSIADLNRLVSNKEVKSILGKTSMRDALMYMRDEILPLCYCAKNAPKNIRWENFDFGIRNFGEVHIPGCLGIPSYPDSGYFYAVSSPFVWQAKLMLEIYDKGEASPYDMSIESIAAIVGNYPSDSPTYQDLQLVINKKAPMRGRMLELERVLHTIEAKSRWSVWDIDELTAHLVSSRVKYLHSVDGYTCFIL